MFIFSHPNSWYNEINYEMLIRIIYSFLTRSTNITMDIELSSLISNSISCSMYIFYKYASMPNYLNVMSFQIDFFFLNLEAIVTIEDTFSEMKFLLGNGHRKILDKAVCISYISNMLGKSINPTILPPAMDE